MKKETIDNGKRGLIASIGALVGGSILFNSIENVQAHDQFNLLIVGEEGQFALIEEALSSIILPSDSNRYVIELLPGTHFVDSILTIPSYVSIVGYGREVSFIDCIGNYSCLKFKSNQMFSNFSIRGNRASINSSNGIFISSEYGKDILFENLSVFLLGGYNCGFYINYFSTIKMNNVHIWTTSIGIKATGYLYLSDCHIRLSGNGTGTPYYGLTCFTGDKASVRFFIYGGFYGVGYGTTNENGFGSNGFSILNDGEQECIVFYIPFDHRKITQTGTRFQLNGVECYARNEHATSDVACHCIRVNGAGIVRLFGGLYQAEMPSLPFGQPIAVFNGNFGTHDTAGFIETYGARITSQIGNISSFNQEPVGVLDVTHNGIFLDSKMGGTYLCDASEGSFEVYLPAEWAKGSAASGSRLRFIKTDDSINEVTIKANGVGATIEGMNQILLQEQYSKVNLLYGESSGKIWFII